MDTQTIRQKITEKFQASTAELKKLTPGVTYGYLASCALLPLIVEANGGNPYGAALALAQIMGGIGQGLIGNQLQNWHDRNTQELTAEITDRIQEDPAWLAEITALLEGLQVPSVVQAVLPEADWDRFQLLLQKELAALEQNIDLRVEGDHNAINIENAGEVTFSGNVTFVTPPDPGQVSEETLRKTYFNRLLTQTGQLDLTGVDKETLQDRDQARLDLAAVYTALDTVQSKGREFGRGEGMAGADGEMLEKGPEMERLSALAFVSQEKYAALLGDPGSGKTTFANFLALCLAGEGLDQPHANLEKLGEDWQLGMVLPVRVVLRQFAAQVLQGSLADCAKTELLWHYIVAELGPSLAQFADCLNRTLLEEGGLLILDGLDEVTEAAQLRETVQQAVLDFQECYPRVRILLTSRTYAYQRQGWRLPGFAETVLTPFDTEQIDLFVDRWYAHMAQIRARLTGDDAQARAELLKQAIHDSDHLSELAPRPLLLTLMASLHAWREGALPQAREQLYKESVELLLEIWQNSKRQADSAWEDPSVREWAKIPRDQFLQAFQTLAYQVHQQQAEPTGTADIEQGYLFQALQEAIPDDDLRPKRVIEYVENRAGLLINRGPGIYSFPHRTFQEYLAACYLTDYEFPYALADLVQADPERWREVALLAGAKVARGTIASAWNLADQLCYKPCDAQTHQANDEGYWWSTLLAGQILVETNIYERAYRSDREVLKRIKTWLTALITHGHLPPVDRALAGRILATLGDERPGVGLRLNGLPDIDWITIEPGPFIMGSDERDNEKPQYTCDP